MMKMSMLCATYWPVLKSQDHGSFTVTILCQRMLHYFPNRSVEMTDLVESTMRAASCQCHCTTDHWHATQRSYLTSIMLTPFATHLQERVKFTVACLVRQSLSRQAPLYLADDSDLVSDSTRRSLRSADISTCMVPRTLSSYGDKFCSCLWNSLPLQLRNPYVTCGLFRRQQKGHLFRKHEHGAV